MSPGTIEQCLPTLIIYHSNLEECFPQAVVTGGLHLRVWDPVFEVYMSVCVIVNSFYQSVLTRTHPGVNSISFEICINKLRQYEALKDN